MKSPQIAGQDDAGRYGHLKVMRSAAGHYVGSSYWDAAGFETPGTRDSGYFATEAEAADELADVEAGGPVARNHP